MKIKTLALALMLSGAVAACSQNQQNDPAKDQAAQDAATAQQKLQDAEKAVEDAKKEAAAADTRAQRAEHAEHKAEAASRITPAPAAVCNDCGVITAMTAIKQEGEGSGAGAVLGAIAGGVAGNQFGGGHGKEAATAVGAIAGGFGGNMAEKKIREKTVYKITVKMDSGYTRTATVGSEAAANYSVGSKVRVDSENNIALR